MIPLMKVHTPPNVGEELQKVWDSGFVTEGEYSDKFEKEFSEYIGNPNTCLVNSCTSALALASRVIGIKEGDEIITTAMTCMATNEPFYNDGAKLVFADIDPTTGNISATDIEHRITSKTKAILVVHWGGQPADLEEINEIAQRHNIKVIEDAAHAVRSYYKGIRIGNTSDFVCFSFQAVKHLCTGDGGAIACKSKEDADRIRKIRWFGLDRKFKGPSRWEQDITESGFKYHMNNINASIGLLQMPYLDKLIDEHIKNSDYLHKKIKNPNVSHLVRKQDRVSSCWLHSILVEDRDKFREYMKSNGIHVDVAHVSNLQYTVFNKFKKETLHGLEFFDEKLINIPCGWWLSEKDLKYIVETINKYNT